MAKRAVGTSAISSLNVKVAPHLIADTELQESVNGWTSQDGAWNVAQKPSSLYTGSNIVAFEAGRMGGADHLVWIDGTTLYDNGASVGTVTGADTNTDIHAVDDAFLIVGATKNYIYDGNHLREMGTWQADYIYSVNEYDTPAGALTITDMTEGSTTVIEFASNTFRVGDRVKVAGITTGPTELNDEYFTVTASTLGASGTITIDVDTSSSTAWSADGTVVGASDLVGDYRWYIVPCLRLSDGTVLTGKPRGLLIEGDRSYGVAHYDLGPTDQTDPSVLSLTGGEQIILGSTRSTSDSVWVYFNVDGTDLFDISGTAGTDYYRGARIYRTKADGYDAYLEREYFEDDDYCTTFTDGSSSGINIVRMFVGIPDADLGAVLTYGYNEHTNPPQSEVGTVAGQRSWVASGSELHWSSLDGIEYYSDTGYTPMKDTITSLSVWRDYCVVHSADRMWMVRIVGGLPVVEEIQTPAGTIWPKAVRSSNLGVMWLRTDGLYVFNGGIPEKVSRRGFSSITSPQSCVQAGDVIYMSGSEKAYVALDRGGHYEWHESEHYLPYASQTSGVLYGAGTYKVSSLFTGQRTEGRLKTKKWGGLDMSASYKLLIDFEGDTVPEVFVNGNHQSDVQYHRALDDYQFPDRRVLWVYLPRLSNEYVEVEFLCMGNATVYGVALEQEK